MRQLFLMTAGFLLTTVAFGQVGLQGQPAKNPDLNRALDSATTAFVNAQRDAASGNAIQFRNSLNVANVRWAECYGKFREWPTSDTAWRANFDGINAALLNAVNALTPGNNLPAAKAQMDSAVGTLAGLRSRNGIVDIRGAASSFDASIKALDTVIAGLQGRPLTPADVDALKTAFGSVRDNHTLFTQAVVDYNAFGLGQGRLDELRKLIAVQGIAFDSINNILSNPQTGQLVTQWQAVRDQLVAFLTDMNKEMPAADAATVAKSVPTVQPDNGQPAPEPSTTPEGHDRPRLFPRLRR